jgi:hypothetical protein
MSPQEQAKKWAENLTRAKPSIRAGVQAVTQSPTQKAAAAVDKYREGVIRAVDNGSFVAGCNRVTLQEWKDKMINKGLANLETGVREGESRMAAFMAKAAPYFKQAKEAASQVEGTGRAAAMEKMTRVWDVMEELRQANQRG